MNHIRNVLPVMLKEKFHDRKISKLEGFVWKTM